MSSHGHGRRAPVPGGTVILSRLDGGWSSILAEAPSVKFVLEGEEFYEIGRQTRRLAKGEFMLMEAGAEFRVRTSRTEMSVGLCVYLSGPDIAPSDAADALLFGPAVLSGSSADPLAGLMRRYASLLLRNPHAGPELARRIVQEVGSEATAYCCAFERQLDRMRSVKQATRVKTLQRLERARGFIHANADRPVTLDEIAGHAALSRFHLTRSFAEAYGAPPLAYHRTLRLEGAAARLRRGECSPTGLSEELGYASLSAFTRAFRQRFGVPPSKAAQIA